MKIRITKTPREQGLQNLQHGGVFANGLLEVNNGGAHGMNEYQGVPMGADAQGTPNVVEEGETIYDDYVFSNRIKIPGMLKKKYKLGGKKKGMTFADASKKLARESSERPNDPISSLGLEVAMNELRQQQDMVKQAREVGRMQAEQDIMHSMGLPTPEELGMAQQQQDAMNAQMAQQQAMQAAPMADPQQAMIQGFDLGGKVNRFDESSYINKGNVNWPLSYSEGKENKFVVPYVSGYPEFKGYFYNPLNAWGNRVLPTYNQHTTKTTWPSTNGSYPLSVTPTSSYQAASTTTSAGRSELNTSRTTAAKSASVPTQPDTSTGSTPPTAPSQTSAKDAIAAATDEAGRLRIERAKAGQETLPKVPPLMNPRSEWARKFPLYASGAQVLTDALGLTNKPDYTEANMIRRASDSNYLPVRAGTLGNRLTFRPFDRNWALNEQRAANAANMGAIRGNAGLNRGIASNALLANNANYINGIGQIMKSAEEYNRDTREKVATFNRSTDSENIRNAMTAATANQNAFAQARQRYLTGITAAAGAHERERNAVDEARAQNMTNFISSMGEYGKDNMNYNKMLFALQSGAFGPVRPELLQYLGIKSKGGKLKRKSRKWL